MDPSEFFTASRILMVAGKGGVGKTTVAATLGVAASRLGIDTLLVEIEGKRGLASLFGHADLVYDDTELIPADAAAGVAALRARTIRAEAALLDYLDDHKLGRFAKTLTRMQVLDTLATSTPGLKDLIVLGKIKQLEQTANAELIIVDAPASGHAISFLRAASGLQATVDTGPIRRQADEVVALLTDPARAQVLLVTLPEETPVNELIETAYALEDEVGIRLGPAVVNAIHEPLPPSALGPAGGAHEDRAQRDGVLDDAAAATVYWQKRAAAEQEQVDRLALELPLEQLRLPRKLTTRLTTDDLYDFAEGVAAQVESLRFTEVA